MPLENIPMNTRAEAQGSKATHSHEDTSNSARPLGHYYVNGELISPDSYGKQSVNEIEYSVREIYNSIFTLNKYQNHFQLPNNDGMLWRRLLSTATNTLEEVLNNESLQGHEKDLKFIELVYSIMDLIVPLSGKDIIFKNLKGKYNTEITISLHSLRNAINNFNSLAKSLL